jgi:uncharacterized protein (DUF58 family)
VFRPGDSRYLPTRGGVALALLGLGIFGAAQTTGAGWLTVLSSIVAGTIAVGVIWPIILIRTVELSVTTPADAVANRPFPLDVRVERPTAGVRIEPSDLIAQPVWAQPPSGGVIEASAGIRGVFDSIGFDVSCSAPFDLFTARRHIPVELPQPLYVAPEPIPMQLPDRLLGGSGGDGMSAGGSGPGETVRSLREYTPGDAMRMVHWKASARRDQLLIKELEPPQRPHLAIAVDVSGADGEQAAGRAAGLIRTARRQGHPVTLLTVEAAGQIAGDVGSVREAGRRLAAATRGSPPTGPVPDGAEFIRLGGIPGAETP